MFKRLLKVLFENKPVTLWCGYVGNRQYLHVHENHEQVDAEVPEEPGTRVKVIRQTNYCHQYRRCEERHISFIKVT